MSFFLLKDLRLSTATIDVNGLDESALPWERIESSVLKPIFEALNESAGPIQTYDGAELRQICAAASNDNEYVISLDQGSYFDSADFQMEVTRVATSLMHLGSQHLQHMPRNEANSLADQTHRIAAHINALPGERPTVVLADDGLGSGGTLKAVVDELAKVDVKVDGIRVICNNTLVSAIDRVPIDSLLVSVINQPWLNERDLLWGVSRSGASYRPNGTTYGIPFSIDSHLAQLRYGIADDVQGFRAVCLERNIEWVEILEDVAGRRLTCDEFPQLGFVAAETGFAGILLTEFIAAVATQDEPAAKLLTKRGMKRLRLGQ